MSGKIFIGTSGWNYAYWSNGTYIYFNNDTQAFAIKNALTLIGMIDAKYLARAGS